MSGIFALVERARRALDLAERMALYAQAELILVEQVPLLPLSYPRVAYAGQAMGPEQLAGQRRARSSGRTWSSSRTEGCRADQRRWRQVRDERTRATTNVLSRSRHRSMVEARHSSKTPGRSMRVLAAEGFPHGKQLHGNSSPLLRTVVQDPDAVVDKFARLSYNYLAGHCTTPVPLTPHRNSLRA